jgi:hypothetical protein
MEQPKSINWFSRLWWLWAAIAGFICGRGYELILDYPEWHYSMFLHANGVEEYIAITGWLILGPLPAAILVVIVVGCVRLWLRRKSKSAQ